MFRLIAAAFAALALTGCVDNSINALRTNTGLAIETRSSLTAEQVAGTTYYVYPIADPAFLADPKIANDMVMLKPTEFNLLLDRMATGLALHGMTRTDDLESADYVIGVIAGTTDIHHVETRPVYGGGERVEYEIEREVPHYNNRGQYIGTWTERETVYVRTPRVQTGVRSQEYQVPVVAMTMRMIRQDVFEEYWLSERTDEYVFERTRALYGGSAFVMDLEATPSGRGRCLIDALTVDFPDAIPQHAVLLQNQPNCTLMYNDPNPVIIPPSRPIQLN